MKVKKKKRLQNHSNRNHCAAFTQQRMKESVLNNLLRDGEVLIAQQKLAIK